MSEFGGGLGPQRPPYPSTENEIGKRTIANPILVNSSESELKTPSVQMIYAALSRLIFSPSFLWGSLVDYFRRLLIVIFVGLGGLRLYQTSGSQSLSRLSVTACRGCKPRRKILTAFHLFTTVD